MKLSLAWIFDHISHNIKSFSEINIAELINQFTLKSAEIEAATPLNIDLDNFSIFKVTKTTEEIIYVESVEWGKKIELPKRQDRPTHIGSLYLVKKEKKEFSWATYEDFGSSKEGLFPNIWASETMLLGTWKNKLTLDCKDYIINIDNKSLTNRPDLWSHRGIAREMTVLLGKKLVLEEDLLSSKSIKHYSNSSSATSNNPFKIEIDTCGDKPICKRLAGLYISEIENNPSDVVMAIKLAKIDNRPINMIVDITNYVMLDIGQPMHAFDSSKIESHLILGRCAKNQEKITLLDGKTIELSETDYVITDGYKPIALAGIMGGSETAVSKDTTQIFIESANFDGSAIRSTSTKLKIRTESSSRFEKSLDPNQNTNAILRYLKLLHNMNVEFKSSDSIISLGNLNKEQVIVLTQDFIDKKIGIHISSDRIETILKSLGFGVIAKFEADNKNIIYNVIVPTYRSRDITIAEDLIEEIIRFTGFSNIPLEAPIRSMSYFDIEPIMNLRNIKRELAFGLNMNEVQNYAFYDEEFLQTIKYLPEHYLSLLNPLSQVHQKLVRSLVPGILKNISSNYMKQEDLSFFEYNSIWDSKGDNYSENKQLAGIFYSKHNKIDFYTYKAQIIRLFNMLKLEKELIFKKPNTVSLWYDKNQTADIWVKNKLIGTCGKINKFMMSHMASGDAFIFELDGNFLVNHTITINKLKHLNKFQEVYQDISMLVPYTISVDDLENIIKKSDNKIQEVSLIDYFEKPEWKNKRSITIRYEIYNEEKTLTKPEIESISNTVTNNINNLGIEIR